MRNGVVSDTESIKRNFLSPVPPEGCIELQLGTMYFFSFNKC